METAMSEMTQTTSQTPPHPSGTVTEAGPAAARSDPPPHQRPAPRRGGLRMTRLLYHADSLVYVFVGVCFFGAALSSLAYAIVNFWRSLSSDAFTGGAVAQDIITFVSDLLLTLIIMEVLGTVIHYLQARETSLKPFLFIGIISATRGILAVGARLSVASSSTLQADEFQRSMIELGVNAVVIIALGVTLRLIGDFLEEHDARPAE
jgi:uncharacterized membrane protein (DUF373 family)